MPNETDMAIAPKCNRCHKELIQPGGLVFSPPDHMGRVWKYHLCRTCYGVIKGLLTAESGASG